MTVISAESLSLLPGGLPCPLCAQPCSRPGQLLPPGAIWGVTMGSSADSPGLWLSRKPDTKSSPLPRPSQSQSLASASVYNFWSRPGCLVWDKAQSGRATPCHHSGKQLPYLPGQTLVSKSPESWAAHSGPRRRMPGDGCGRKTVTPAGFNHPGCAEELGGTSCGGRRQCWKQGDSPRLEVLWECVWGALGRRVDAGHSGCREELISNPKHKKSSLQLDKFGKGHQVCSPPALQAVLCLWRITDILDQARYHVGADGDVSLPWFCSVESMKGERAFLWVRAALSGVLLHQDNPGTCRGCQGGTVGQMGMGFLMRKP